jgi:hypothetical protein
LARQQYAGKSILVIYGVMAIRKLWLTMNRSKVLNIYFEVGVTSKDKLIISISWL